SNVGQGENYCKKFDGHRPPLQITAGTAAATTLDDNARRVVISFGRMFSARAVSRRRYLFSPDYSRSTSSPTNFSLVGRSDKILRIPPETAAWLIYTLPIHP